VATLTALERLVVAAHRAGCGPIHVIGAGERRPAFRRVEALGIDCRFSATPPVMEGPAFVAAGHLLLTVRDVKRLVEGRARLAVEGRPWLAGYAARVTGDPGRDLAGAPSMGPEGVVAEVTDRESARAAAKVLWASLTSASDGLVDRYFNRPLGRPLSKLIIRTPITPNQVSVGATLLGVISAICFGWGRADLAILGAVLLQLSAVIDCVDGDVARVVFKESPLGKWLDIVGDQVVHIGVFVGIGVGLWRAGVDAPVLALAGSAAVGVVVSFAVVVRGLVNPALQQNTALQKLIDATTNRDFSVLLLALSVAHRLEWFLWMAAIGVHVFWVLALSLQRRQAPGPA
jgi:phosphatidylglycerophosphate synthase